MKLFLKDQRPDYLFVERNASVVSQETADTSFYNQSSGDELKAYFSNNKVKRVTIQGNARSIYVPHNENNEIIGMVSVEQGDIEMFMDKDGKMEKILVAPQPKGKFFPLHLISPADKRIPLFSWAVDQRPNGPQDVFRHSIDQDQRFVEDKNQGQGLKRATRRNKKK